MYIWLWKASNPSLNEIKLFLIHHTYILVVQKREDQRKTVISTWHRQNMKHLPLLSSRHFGHSLPFFFSKFIKPANTIVPMDILSMTLIKIILWMVFVWKLLNWSKLMKIRCQSISRLRCSKTSGQGFWPLQWRVSTLTLEQCPFEQIFLFGSSLTQGCQCKWTRPQSLSWWLFWNTLNSPIVA